MVLRRSTCGRISVVEVEMTLVRESFQELLVALFRRVRSRYVAADQALHWEVFLRRFIEPVLTSRAPASYAEIADELAIENVKKVCNLATTVLREFRRVWWELLSQDYGKDEAKIQEALVDFGARRAEGGMIDVRGLLLNSGLAERNSIDS